MADCFVNCMAPIVLPDIGVSTGPVWHKYHDAGGVPSVGEYYGRCLLEATRRFGWPDDVGVFLQERYDEHRRLHPLPDPGLGKTTMGNTVSLEIAGSNPFLVLTSFWQPTHDPFLNELFKTHEQGHVLHALAGPAGVNQCMEAYGLRLYLPARLLFNADSRVDEVVANLFSAHGFAQTFGGDSERIGEYVRKAPYGAQSLDIYERAKRWTGEPLPLDRLLN